MEIVGDSLILGNRVVVHIKDNTLYFYYFNDWSNLDNSDCICVMVDLSNMKINNIDVTDKDFTKFKINFARLFISIKANQLKNVETEYNLLRPFRGLLHEKIKYALSRDYIINNRRHFLEMSVSIVSSTKYVDNCRVIVINGFEFTTVESRLSGSELYRQVYNQFIKYICEPYPSVIKSARN